MRLYQTMSGFTDRKLYNTDPNKYYLCYNGSSHYDNVPELRYMSIFKGSGDMLETYQELNIIVLNLKIWKIREFLTEDELADDQRFVTGDIIFELTDEEVLNNLVLESI